MRFSLSLLLLFLLNVCFASQETSSHPIDTTILTKDQYKLGREQFLAQYGRDDSSRAFINFYFKKRSRWKRSLMINAALITIFSIASAAWLSSSESTLTLGGAIFAAVVETYILTFQSISEIIFIVDGILLLTHSRKRLLQILNAYGDGKALPAAITRKRLFRRYLAVEKHSLIRN